MSRGECIHGFDPGDCAACAGRIGRGAAASADRSGEEKLLIFCPALAPDTLLHFVRRGESYRLRAYVGRRDGEVWRQEDARSATEFLRRYRPAVLVDVAGERIAVERADRWATIIGRHNARLGIGPSKPAETAIRHV